jgi:hypothetical protein
MTAGLGALLAIRLSSQLDISLLLQAPLLIPLFVSTSSLSLSLHIESVTRCTPR